MELVKGWVITDHPNAEAGFNREGMGQIEQNGPTIKGIDPDTIHSPIKFALYDGDENYEYGGYISRQWLYSEEFLAFAPLQYGEVDTGCTIMKVFENGEWQYL